MAIFTAFGRFDLALVASLGLFAVLYSPDTPYRRRLAVVGGIAVTFFVGAALGIATADNQAMLLVTLIVLGPVSAFVCNALLVGPPSAYFIMLGCGVANYLVSARGIPAREILAMTAVGGVIAVAVTMAELSLDPGRPERMAIDKAIDVVNTYGETEPGQDAAAAHSAAAEALHAGWTALNDAAPLCPSRPWAARRMARLAAERKRLVVAQKVFDLRLQQGSSQYFGHRRVAEVAEDMEFVASAGRGRGPALVLLSQSAQWPSENLVSAFRVLVATALAGILTFLIAGEHIYWSTAFAALALHQGGPRIVQTYRGINRLAGTVLGIGLFVLIALWHPNVWLLLLVIALLQFLIEIFIARQYALGSMFITPVALLISIGGHFPDSPWPLAGERLLDTIIGIGAAMIAVWAMGQNLPVQLLRGHTVRTLDAAADFIDGPGDPERADRLFTQSRLLRNVANAVSVDGGRAAGTGLTSAREVEHIGFMLLGAVHRTQSAADDAALARVRLTLLDMAGRLRGAYMRADDHDLEGALDELAEIARPRRG